MLMPAMTVSGWRGGSVAIRSMAIRSMVMATVIVPVTMPCGRATALKGFGGDHQGDCHRLLQHSRDQSCEHPGNQGAREYALEHPVSAMIGQ